MVFPSSTCPVRAALLPVVPVDSRAIPKSGFGRFFYVHGACTGIRSGKAVSRRGDKRQGMGQHPSHRRRWRSDLLPVGDAQARRSTAGAPPPRSSADLRLKRSPGLRGLARPAGADQPKPKAPRQTLAPGAAQLLAQRAGPVIRQAPPGATPQAAAAGLSCTARAKPAPQSDGGLAIIVRPCANGLRSLFMKNKKVSAGAQTLPIHGLCMTHS